MQRDLSYGCNSVGSSIGCSSVEHVRQGGLALAQRTVLDNQGDTQYGVLVEHSSC